MGIFGVIGHPISHSMSPIMHNCEFKKLGCPHHYTAFDVHPDNLKNAIDGMRALNILGLNVTIPHKVAVMEWLDEIDEEARLIGAVNTIKNENGRLIGSNTDGEGYLRSLKELIDHPFHDKNVLIIGAGGASRAIVTALARYGVSRIDIANRTLQKAEQLAMHVRQFGKSNAIPLKEAEEKLSTYGIIVNTTSVGMSPNLPDMPINIHHLEKGTIVSDLIYNPLSTMFLKKAKEKGAITANGVGMFVHQGALSFEKWLGIAPNTERMTETVLKKLGG